LEEKKENEPIRSKQQVYTQMIDELTPPKPPEFDSLTEQRHKAALALAARKSYKRALKAEEDDQVRQVFNEVKRSESGMKITLKRVHDQIDNVPEEDENAANKENKDPTKITRKQLVQRSASIIQEKQKKLDELTDIKIKVGKAMEIATTECIQQKKEELALKKREVETMEKLTEMVALLIQSSAVNTHRRNNSNSLNSVD
jgi:hypothetical protein